MKKKQMIQYCILLKHVAFNGAVKTWMYAVSCPMYCMYKSLLMHSASVRPELEQLGFLSFKHNIRTEHITFGWFSFPAAITGTKTELCANYLKQKAACVHL